MPQDRRIWIAAAALGGAALLFAAFAIGRATAPSDQGTAAPPTTIATTTTTNASGAASQGDSTPTTTLPTPSVSDVVISDAEVPEYGTTAERDAFISALAEAGLGISSRTDILSIADRICYDLERLEAQGRSPAFAVRVVWNESLAELDSAEIAGFAAIFNAAPFYLCEASAPFAEEVAYWLGV